MKAAENAAAPLESLSGPVLGDVAAVSGAASAAATVGCFASISRRC